MAQTNRLGKLYELTSRQSEEKADLVLSLYLREFRDHLNSLKDRNQAYADQVALMRNFTTSSLTSVSREGDNMSEAITDKLHNIDNRLSVAETEIKHISQGIGRIEGDIGKLDGKIEKILDKLTNVVTKDDLKASVESRRFGITTWIALGAFIAAVAAVVVPLVTK